MSELSRFLNSVNLYNTAMYNCNKNGIIVIIMSGFNFIKKVKLRKHARRAVLLIYFDCRGWGIELEFDFSCTYIYYPVLLQVR